MSISKLECIILAEFEKEYYCHLQFVREIAKQLCDTKGGDWTIIEAAAIAHDYGRSKEIGDENHETTGARLLAELLPQLGYDSEISKKICSCTKKHNGHYGFETIEEEIVANADSASKILFHEAFMLMCKKESFRERAAWGIKYLQKGYNIITFPDLKELTRSKKEGLEGIYNSVAGYKN